MRIKKQEGRPSCFLDVKLQDKKERRCLSNAFFRMRSNGPFDLIGTEASGTSIHVARSTVDNGLDPLYIGLPGTVGPSVGVGNLNTESNALATIFTLCHTLHLLSA